MSSPTAVKYQTLSRQDARRMLHQVRVAKGDGSSKWFLEPPEQQEPLPVPGPKSKITSPKPRHCRSVPLVDDRVPVEIILSPRTPSPATSDSQISFEQFILEIEDAHEKFDLESDALLPPVVQELMSMEMEDMVKKVEAFKKAIS